MNLDKNNNQNKKETKGKSLSDFFGGPFFVCPRHLIEKRLDLTKASSFKIQDYFFAYFSSESGQRIGFKHFFVQQLAKELRMDRKTFRDGLREVEEAGILKFYDFEHKGKICFYENDFNKDLIKKLDAGELFINIDMRLNISISDKKIDEKIINFPLNEVGKLPPSSGETTPIKWGNYPHQVGKLPPSSGETTPILATATSFNWSTFEPDFKKTQEYYIKEYIKESFIKEDKFTEVSNEEKKNVKNNDEMNDDINIKNVKNEDDKISIFYLAKMIDLGIYEKNAKIFLSKLSTDDIQKAFDKLEAAKDLGHYIKNEGNFIRETLEVMIDPNFKPKFSIQEKETEVLNIPEPIRKTNPNELEIKLNKYLEFFTPNITKVIHNFDTKLDEFNKKVVDKFNAYIVEIYTEDPELNDNRDRFIAQMRDIKKDSNNKVKDLILLSYHNPILNKKDPISGKRILDNIIDWFEGI